MQLDTDATGVDAETGTVLARTFGFLQPIEMNFLRLFRAKSPSASPVITAPVRPPRLLKPARLTTSLAPASKPPTPQRQVEPRFKRPRARPARDLVDRFEHQVPEVITTRRERQSAATRAAAVYSLMAPEVGSDAALRAIRSDWSRLQEDIAEQLAMGAFDDSRDDLDDHDFHVPMIEEWVPDYDRDTWSP